MGKGLTHDASMRIAADERTDLPPTELPHRACARVAWHGPPLDQTLGNVPDAKPSTDPVTEGSQKASG